VPSKSDQPAYGDSPQYNTHTILTGSAQKINEDDDENNEKLAEKKITSEEMKSSSHSLEKAQTDQKLTEKHETEEGESESLRASVEMEFQVQMDSDKVVKPSRDP